ncbi:hypothetical protein [Nonomuraea composti]|nr:hypothetical protein [Nonomuraea sp. FMUSA5-5]
MASDEVAPRASVTPGAHRPRTAVVPAFAMRALPWRRATWPGAPP